jgi:mannan endo-1,4-beta-mannosidase
MSYLVDNYGEHILSGQQEIYKYGPHDFEYEFEYINDLTGEYPAIRGFDFMNSANPLYGSDDGTVDRMIDWANNRNGIVTASWHITVPKDFDSYTLGESVAWADSTYEPDKTNFDPSKILEEGSDERAYYMLCLEQLASCIQELQDAGVPLIFRPLHEAEGGGGETGSWFWWGKSGSAVYKELWKLTYETLTEDYGLHNIIWEWNSYAYSTSTDWYPGDEYVDIVAYDKYNCTDWSTGSAVLTHNDSAISGTFYNLVDMYPGKMVAMSENDSIPTLENLTSEKAGWLYFLPWYDGGSDSINFLSNPVFNTTEDLITMYQSDYCITLDELPTDLYTGYSLDGFVDSEPKEPSNDKDTTSTVTTTTNKTEEKVVTLDSSDFTETADGFSFTVEDPENISKIELIGSISDTDDSSWYCGGGGVVFGLGEDDDYAFLDYMFNKGDSKVTVKVNGTFKSGETDADGNNLETTGTINSKTIEVTKWWGSSATDDSGANVSMDITGVKVYYKEAETTSATESTEDTEATTTDASPSETTADVDVTTTTDDSSSSDSQETTTLKDIDSTVSGLNGDVNDDGTIDVLDLLLAKKYVLQMADETSINFNNADVNGDGDVNAVDILNIKKYLLLILSQDELNALKG